MDAPARSLSPLARWVWTLQQLAFWGVVTAIGFAVGANVDFGGAWLWALPLAVLVAAVVGVPALRWRRWRWDIRDEGIDIQRGTLAISRTLVPWVRVQHVDTRRGVFEQMFGLSTVVVHTAAGGHTIPLLPAGDAEQLRERIAGLARTDEDEPHANAQWAGAEPAGTERAGAERTGAGADAARTVAGPDGDPRG
jgi:membrane protein YdbS with pleckstrin-like domain